MVGVTLSDVALCFEAVPRGTGRLAVVRRRRRVLREWWFDVLARKVGEVVGP